MGDILVKLWFVDIVESLFSQILRILLMFVLKLKGALTFVARFIRSTLEGNGFTTHFF